MRARSSSISQFVESPKPISFAAASRSTVFHGSGSRRRSWNSTGSARAESIAALMPVTYAVARAATRGGQLTRLALGDAAHAERAHQPVRGQGVLPGELGQPPGGGAAEELELPETVLRHGRSRVRT